MTLLSDFFGIVARERLLRFPFPGRFHGARRAVTPFVGGIARPDSVRIATA